MRNATAEAMEHRRKVIRHQERIEMINIVVSYLRTAKMDRDGAVELITKAHELLGKEIGGFVDVDVSRLD